MAPPPTRPQARPRPKVIVTRRLPQLVETRMAELFDVELNLSDEPMTAAALADAAGRCDVLVPTVTDEIDAAVFANSGRLKLLANFGVGVDHIDLGAARAAGVVVTNTPGVLTDDTADMVMALILGVPRRLAEGEKLVRAGEWNGWSPTGMLGHRITGKRLGIIGMGRIGRAVATRARAFGLTVHYHNRHRLPAEVESALEATWWDNLDAMLARVDIITINCPHTAETHHLVGERQFALMQRQAYIINAARGEIVDENALCEALTAGRIAGAGLDVFENEPAIDPRLLDLPGVVLVPHMGSATFEGRQAMGEKVIANIRVWADGHRPLDQVLEGWA
ncbi:2-hydroxyacid dehydrogenase [Polymorphobacter fuscus]|uniref:D-glycerate dehydrogenase n=1 Tax=Sandarakinorhabdus fusca TaxID=1439888 RepID=A0A7C9KL26_9SPHN|nr:D-glycerate dehydrogenase [Polymorphobacter fuscus]KAB7647610.1 D-glycerate dehydrogenase [Polymorphobacter fuscus]MQT16883.1 D-glycerate dehydrogenase [Polymorphobacter fuscus]NJC09128.1 glyoxylate reductase [Polymorphobacter fuscus]